MVVLFDTTVRFAIYYITTQLTLLSSMQSLTVMFCITDGYWTLSNEMKRKCQVISVCSMNITYMGALNELEPTE